MQKPWRSIDNCKDVLSYSVPQAALLWCGVPIDQIQEELSLAKPVGESSGKQKTILRHPYIPCLEPKCRMLTDAIDNSELPVGRDGGTAKLLKEDFVAYSRRTIFAVDLKTWISAHFPNDKPATRFDEIERNVHTAISKEAYLALQAEKNALTSKLEKTKTAYSELKVENEKLEGQIKSLEKMVASSSERTEVSYLNIIGALVSLILDKTPGGQKISVYNNQAAIINGLLGHFPGVYGISERNLEEKFAQAKRSLKQS